MRKAILEGLERGIFPGAVVCVSRHGDPMFYEAHGLAEMTPGEREVALDTRYDISSLTQVVATMPAVLRTVQMGKLSLVDPIVRWLPEFATGVDRYTKAQVNVFHLLTHTSGLPAWRPYYLSSRGTKAYLRSLADTPLENAPGTKVTTSDLGYMLLGFMLERIWDRPLSEVCERLVFGPLEMGQTCFAGDGLPAELCAATEVGNEYERKLCAHHGRAHFPWRGNMICGEVHDGNAFYGLDGVAGHAGVFSTAGDLNRYAEMWVRKGIYQRERFLDATLVTLATSVHGAMNGQGGGFGWETAGPDCSIGETARPNMFGASGFSGVSIWCDPLHKLTSVVLTNRLHPHVRDGMSEWRARFHKLVFQTDNRY